MCDNWQCPFFAYQDCMKDENDPCPLEDDDDYYDNLGDEIFHYRQDMERCNV